MHEGESHWSVTLGGQHESTNRTRNRLPIGPRTSVYANVQNLFSEHYFEAFGYPALPLTFRTGIKMNFGGSRGSSIRS
jgi:outer membrane receptor protein involved in Fe transport